MLKYREDSPIASDVSALSPTSRRKAEFLFSQFPNDVMGRARSTLSSLGGAWRPKSYGGTSNVINPVTKNTKNSNNNRSTLAFFQWSRYKDKNKEKKIIADENDKNNFPNNNNINDKTENNINTNSMSSIYDGKESDVRVLVDNSNKKKLLTNSSSDTNHNNLINDRRLKKITKNKSLDIDDYLMLDDDKKFNEKEVKISRSINCLIDEITDEKLTDKNNKILNDYLYQNKGSSDVLTNTTKSTNNHRSNNNDHKTKSIEIINGKYNTERRRSSVVSKKTQHTLKKLHVKPATPSTYNGKDKIYKYNNNNINKRRSSDVVLEFENSNTESIEINDSNENVINARLRLQKLISADDSVLHYRSPTTRSTSLFRHNSVETKISSSFPERSISPTILEEHTSDEESDNICYRDENDIRLKIEKPRKKLSFRDPEVITKTNIVNKNNYCDNNFTLPLSNLDSDLESQAMRIVRTVGQAFEVCHKKSVEKNNDDRSGTPCDSSVQDHCSETLSDDDEPKKEPIPVTPELQLKRPNHLEIMPQLNTYSTSKKSLLGDNDDKSVSPSTSIELQRLREQLEGQSLQTRQAVEQLMLVRGQLISETNARMEAQARTQQLLQQNRELLEHIASLGGYHEPDRPGFNAATLGIAPQSPMYMPDQDLGSPLRKTFGVGGSQITSSSSLSALNQQWNNLGAINQQLSTLNQQLNGLNQQNHNLQSLQQQMTQQQQQQQQTPQLNHIPKLGNLQNNDNMLTQQDLFQLNQDLLNRLQNLNLGYNNNSVNNNSPHNSYLYTNQNQFNLNNNNNLNNNLNNNNNNFNLLSSPSSVGNLTPSPIGTLNRSSYSASPLDDSLGLIIDRNYDLSDDTQFIKPLSQVGTLTTLDNDGKVKVIVPISTRDINNYDQQIISTKQRKEKKVTLPNTNNIVTLKVTDESGNITNTKKLPATPSFITRSTSEKVHNRSPMMSEVQRTTWARHTTK